MLQYVGTVLYVWGFMAVTVGPYLWQPYTGKGPPGTYAKNDQIPPAPPIAEIGPKIQTRFVKVETIKPVKVPAECKDLAAGEGLPTDRMTQDQARRAKAKLESARQTREVRRCRAAIEKG